MLRGPGGGERTESEYACLLTESGFRTLQVLRPDVIASSKRWLRRANTRAEAGAIRSIPFLPFQCLPAPAVQEQVVAKERRCTARVHLSQNARAVAQICVVAEREELGSNALLICSVEFPHAIETGSNSGIQKRRKFGSEKFGISLAHQSGFLFSLGSRPRVPILGSEASQNTGATIIELHEFDFARSEHAAIS